MKNLILSLLCLGFFSSLSWGYGLTANVVEKEGVILTKYILTCSEKNQSCNLLCGNKAVCELPATENCTDCYRDTDLSMRSLFSNPQKRYAVSESIYTAESSNKILKDKDLLVIGVRQNILMDPLNSTAFSDLQTQWNSMCPKPRNESENSFFLMKPIDGIYKPFALMCGEQIHRLNYEISFGRGAVVDDDNEEIVRPENALVLRLSYQLSGAK